MFNLGEMSLNLCEPNLMSSSIAGMEITSPLLGTQFYNANSEFLCEYLKALNSNSNKKAVVSFDTQLFPVVLYLSYLMVLFVLITE